MPAEKLINPRYVVYALSADGVNHRYVGYTASKGVRGRMSSHRHQARKGNPKYLYPWMREVGVDNVVAVVLEKLPDGSSARDLGACEARWIAYLRGRGHGLLNVAAGGVGAAGVQLTDEQRAARIEQLHLRELSMTDEQRQARIDRLRAINATTTSAERADRARKQGTAHMHTPEMHAKSAAARVGKKRKPYNWSNPGGQKASGAHGAHNRWHTGRGIVKPECGYCREEVGTHG